MNYFIIIEIVGSILYFSQKIFLSFGKRIGWLLGFLGSIAFTIVTFHKGSFSYFILEITSGVVFIFGMFAWRKNEILQRNITFVMSGLTIIGILIVLLLNFGSPNRILENVMVILFAIGAVLLVLKNPLGWLLYILGHLVLIFYGYILGTYSIMLLQIISLPFAVIGYENFKKLSTQDTLSNKIMELTNKIVLAHKGFFNKESEELYRENSKEVCSISNTKDYISIIELDVRKSKDGILYCYHGTFFEYCFGLRFSRFFSDIEKKYHVDSLDDILGVIGESKTFFLDIKDTNITKEDILKSFDGKKFKKIILANKSVSFLDRFNNMPKEFVKIFNGNIFCNFYDLVKLREKNFKYFEVVFPFQVRKKALKKVSDAGMEFRCSGLFFRSKESYWQKVNKYSLKHISSDFI